MTKFPKLTVDIFNRPECPPWAKWAAVDKSGGYYVYSDKLSRSRLTWIMWSLVGNCKYIDDYDSSDWQNSLIQRPTSASDINDVKSESALNMYHEDLEKDTSITEDDVNIPPELKRLLSNKRKPAPSVYVGSEIKKDADDVKHPNHYTNTPFGLEVIDITKYYDFCTGNALKYIFRHGKKIYDGLTVKTSAIKDLRKAIQNLEFKIKFIEEEWDDKGTCKSGKEVICPECGRSTASIWSKDGELNGMVTCLSCGYTFDPIVERYQNTGNTIL